MDFYASGKAPSPKDEGIEFMVFRDAHVTVAGMINEKCGPLPIMLDTAGGAPLHLPESVLFSCDVEWIDPEHPRAAGGIGGAFAEWPVRVERLMLANRVWGRMEGRTGGITLELEESLPWVAAVVSPCLLPGNPVLRMDFTKMRLWLE